MGIWKTKNGKYEKCAFCGKLVYVPLWKSNQKTHFCSLECCHEYQKIPTNYKIVEDFAVFYLMDNQGKKHKCYIDIEEDVLDKRPINRTQATLLETLYEVDRICKKHNIDYYYVGETEEEIDKIRDFNSDSTDIHIAMFREDYMNFQQYVQEDLDVWFDYRSIYTHPDHTDMRMYVITDAYGTQEGEYEARFHGCNDIVGIDIAPIDAVNDDDSLEKIKSSILSCITA